MTSEKQYWFTVGGITGLLAFSIIVFPCMVIAGITREMPTITEKMSFGIIPMLSYLIVIRLKVSSLVKFCRKYAEKITEKEIPEAWKA